MTKPAPGPVAAPLIAAALTVIAQAPAAAAAPPRIPSKNQKSRTIVSVDWETWPIFPGMPIPLAVCLGWADSTGACGILNRADGIQYLRRLLWDESVILTGVNIAFDLAVAIAESPDLLPLVFNAYAAGRIVCLIVRQKLIDIAEGSANYRQDDDGEWSKAEYDLASLAQLHLNRVVNKGADTWRMRYWELEGVRVEDYPQDAKDYVLGDAVCGVDLFFAQESNLIRQQGGIPQDEPRQNRKDWALRLMSIWGVRTDPEETRRLREAIDLEIDVMHKALDGLDPDGIPIPGVFPSGILRPMDKKGKRSKNVAEIRRRIEAGYAAQGKTPPLTDGGNTQANRAALIASGDPMLMILANAGAAEKIKSTYIRILEQGTRFPINTKYNPLVSSGRTSSEKPNIQNPPRNGGVRECFIPREGWTFCGVDYDTIELRSLAQVCLWRFGHSTLAEVFKRGEDPHLTMAAEILGISYAECVRRYEQGDPAVDNARQLAKIPNYGFPGGMGPDAFIEFAKQYGVELSRDDAIRLKAIWLRALPEMPEYFNWIDNVAGPLREGTFIQLYSNRIRGRTGFCDGCNTMFQGLTADGAASALWDVAVECYLIESSPLYGCRPVIFMHDEIVIEIPWTDPIRATQAADRLAEIMVAAMQKWMPDIPVAAKPAMYSRFNKGAKSYRTKTPALVTMPDGRKIRVPAGILLPVRPETIDGKKKWIPDVQIESLAA